MKKRLRILAAILFLCGLAAGSAAVWLYTRARAQAAEGMSLKNQALRLHDQSDAFKGTPEEDKLIQEGLRLDQTGDATIAEAQSRRLWAMTYGITSIVLILAAIAALITHLKQKEADSPS